MKRFRDIYNPTAAHTIEVDGVRLDFGSDGILSDPTQAQLDVLTADHMARQRFPEVTTEPFVAKGVVAGTAAFAAAMSEEEEDTEE